jgi:hypothetical protein
MSTTTTTSSGDKTKPQTNIEKFSKALLAATKTATPKSKTELRRTILRGC